MNKENSMITPIEPVLDTPVAPDPVAWMTHHDDPMLFPSAAECAKYCDEGEVPIPLVIGLQVEDYAAAQVRAALAAQASAQGDLYATVNAVVLDLLEAETAEQVMTAIDALAAQAGNDVKDDLYPAAMRMIAQGRGIFQIAAMLGIGHNRAQRLIDAARAAAKEQS